MYKLLFLFFHCLVAFQVIAQKVDTLNVFSPSMNRNVKNVVILPADYESYKDIPVLYLLHGYGGNHNAWLQIKPDLPALAMLYGMIIVCPDGKNSWYWDSPQQAHVRYETFITKELTAFIDQNYKTRKNKSGRAITGLSMGGHGGLWLGIRHQHVFGACGSTSGGVDIRPFPNNWEMEKSLGARDSHPERWNNHTVINQIHLINTDIAIIIDCGTEDFFFEVNEKLHREMLRRNIKHDYIIRPGAHDSKYWKNSIEYQLLFFSRFFRKDTP